MLSQKVSTSCLHFLNSLGPGLRSEKLSKKGLHRLTLENRKVTFGHVGPFSVLLRSFNYQRKRWKNSWATKRSKIKLEVSVMRSQKKKTKESTKRQSKIAAIIIVSLGTITTFASPGWRGVYKLATLQRRLKGLECHAFNVGSVEKIEFYRFWNGVLG